MLDINSCLTGSIFADPYHPGEVPSHGEAPTFEKYNLDPMYRI